jgi:hypothetical protein
MGLEASDGHVDLGQGYAAMAKEAVELAEAVYWPDRWQRAEIATTRLNQLRAAYVKARASIRELEAEGKRLVRSRSAAVRAALLIGVVGAVAICLLMLRFDWPPGVL